MDVYPFDLLPPGSERWRLTSIAVSGGVRVASGPGLARTDGGGFWMCWMNEIELVTRAQIKAARALEAVLDGGASTIIVPAFEWAFSPELVTHSDGTPFSDGSLYQTSAVSSQTLEAAPLRATVIRVSFAGGVPLEAGERFSILHAAKGKRLYTVARVLSVGSADYRVEIRPPLREAVPVGVDLDFSTPGCLMKLANPDEFLGAIDPYHESIANAVWVEAF